MSLRRARWAPSASLENLALRARLLAAVRAFFARRGVMEVEVPHLAAAPVPDTHLQSFSVPTVEGDRYLQTSPEYHLKRLLAAGSGAIYQLGRAFRRGEAGGRHNPEFTMLEWYRPGWSLERLMDEVEELLRELLGVPPGERRSYRQAVGDALGMDPFRASARELAQRAEALGLGAVEGLAKEDREGWLDWLVSRAAEPDFGRGRPLFVYDFPASQAAMAKVEEGVARRFEVYLEGVELANGYDELLDADEQRRRFLHQLEARKRRGLEPVPLDERLLEAMEAGLPSCCGVSVGFDRLVMLAAGADRLSEVVAFPWERA
ncbi:MAG: EF-P lysine aminoacylase EpmA [Acidobacteriota bacterium]